MSSTSPEEDQTTVEKSGQGKPINQPLSLKTATKIQHKERESNQPPIMKTVTCLYQMRGSLVTEHVALKNLSKNLTKQHAYKRKFIETSWFQLNSETQKQAE